MPCFVVFLACQMIIIDIIPLCLCITYVLSVVSRIISLLCWVPSLCVSLYVRVRVRVRVYVCVCVFGSNNGNDINGNK